MPAVRRQEGEPVLLGPPLVALPVVRGKGPDGSILPEDEFQGSLVPLTARSLSGSAVGSPCAVPKEASCVPFDLVECLERTVDGPDDCLVAGRWPSPVGGPHLQRGMCRRAPAEGPFSRRERIENLAKKIKSAFGMHAYDDAGCR